MKYIILMLIFLAAWAAAQDDPLNPMQDIKNTMGEEIFSPSQQDQLGNATPVITGKNLPGSIADSQPSQPKARLLSPTSFLTFRATVLSILLPAQGEAAQPHQYLEPESD